VQLLFGSLIAMQLAGSMTASGAFEVVDTKTGKKLFSRLETGRMPSVQDVLTQLPDVHQ
jgi:hypothetical protein